ncbi:MAG: hypothetical protein IJ258_11260 [Methanobrevibacter sp.]|uniref:hypothetical protein n=1 Tax=Methanobrevibacter sp. TaxID=66852 RepID=UPI0025D5885E|nr:hypothetical protein [Methanobrevibacter sp.]MBQ8018656.1 hypothetical protein [Methanobrevibacter sp.]
MKYLTNNFSLNMVDVNAPYTLQVIPLTQLRFKVESKTAVNRLSQIDICQELDLFPQRGNVSASIGDEIFVAQYKDGELTYRKIIIVGDIQ